MMMLEKFFFWFTCLGSYVDMSILACFHMCACVCVCELRACIIMFTHTCPCEENLILGNIDKHANVGCYEN